MTKRLVGPTGSSSLARVGGGNLRTFAGVFSHAPRLDQVEALSREAIAHALDVDEETVGHLEVHVDPLPRFTRALLNRSEQVAGDARFQLAATQRGGLPKVSGAMACR
jgi:hypothetical protein